MGLTGSIVNVPINIEIIQKALPQSMDETTTIAGTLKRELEYSNAYQTRKVRVYIVMKDLKQLFCKQLYKYKLGSNSSIK